MNKNNWMVLCVISALLFTLSYAYLIKINPKIQAIVGAIGIGILFFISVMMTYGSSIYSKKMKEEMYNE